jgi:hypothetical protein
MSKIFFVEGDTDSIYWAVSGSENDNYEQGFKHVIKDHDFYNANNIAFDKKLLGLAIEKQCENMIALAPKTYSCSINSSNVCKSQFEKLNFNNLQTTATKCKAYNKRGKLNLKTTSICIPKRKLYKEQIIICKGKNLENKDKLLMTNISVTKNILTATHTKYRVSKDFSTCTPLFLPVNE